MVGRGQRTDQNYFHCLAARDWGHTRPARLRNAVKGKNSGENFVLFNVLFINYKTLQHHRNISPLEKSYKVQRILVN